MSVGSGLSYHNAMNLRDFVLARPRSYFSLTITLNPP